MNTPVFAESDTFGEGINTSQEGDFLYGTLPGTKLENLNGSLLNTWIITPLFLV